MVVAGNLFQNSWVAAQAYAVALTVRNQNGPQLANVLREIQLSDNVFRNVEQFLNITSADDGEVNPRGTPSQRTTDVTVRNNLVWPNYFFLNLQNPVPKQRAQRVFVIHNTEGPLEEVAGGVITDFGMTGGADDAVWLNNVHHHRGYGFKSNGPGGTVQQGRNLADYLPPGTTNFRGNMIVNTGAQYTEFPAGWLVTNLWAAQFVNYRDGDFTLAPTSRGKGKALDRRSDIGVDMGLLKAVAEQAESGVWTGPQPPPSSQTTTPRVRPRTVVPRPTP